MIYLVSWTSLERLSVEIEARDKTEALQKWDRNEYDNPESEGIEVEADSITVEELE